MDADDLIARDGQQPEGVVLTQVRLAAERESGEVAERGDLARVGDARLGEACGERRLTLERSF